MTRKILIIVVVLLGLVVCSQIPDIISFCIDYYQLCHFSDHCSNAGAY